jgi:pyrroline-5-carboxylate reductase
MGGALARGWLRGLPDARLTVFDKDPSRAEALTGEAGPRLVIAPSPAEVAASASTIVVSVKPQDTEPLLQELGPVTRPDSVIVSTAAGVTLERLRSALGGEGGLARIMPNLAVGVGEGVIALAPEPALSSERVSELSGLLGRLGRVELLAENLFDAVTALTASGPGFLALALEGLEDGGVRTGLPRQVARVFSQQMALGAARLLLEEGLSPATLKDRVASPAGTTIAGLAVLEERGVRGAFLRAVEAAAGRGRGL